MSKQLKKDEWLYFFDLYEKDINKFKKEYEIKKIKNQLMVLYILI